MAVEIKLIKSQCHPLCHGVCMHHIARLLTRGKIFVTLGEITKTSHSDIKLIANVCGLISTISILQESLTDGRVP